MKRTTFQDQFKSAADACRLAQAIVDTVREPVLVLDASLSVLGASRSFYAAFGVTPEETQNVSLYALGDGQWDIPKLRILLEQIIPQNGTIENYEVEHIFPKLGHRTMSLNACQIFYEGNSSSTILLSIEDVTRERANALAMQELLMQKEVLLSELEHRIANSLQIIASIILMKARTATSEETRAQLRDAHNRVISVAAIQKQLHPSIDGGRVEMAPYLARLCDTLAASVMGDTHTIALDVAGEHGSATPRDAESLGLIATELVMNALKHAFPDAETIGKISVRYEVNGANWKLTVADNGIGKEDGVFAQPKTGLGTGIVKALAQQLEAVVETVADQNGTTVTITHAKFIAKPSANDPDPVSAIGAG